MSRIDDSDRQAQRVAERLALEKRQQEGRAKKRLEGESAFAKLVQQGQARGRQAQRLTQAQAAAQQYLQGAREGGDVSGPGGIVEEAILLAESSRAQDAQGRATTQRAARSFTERLKQARAGEGERASESRLSDAGRDGLAAQGRGADQIGNELGAQSRREDARLGREALAERGEASAQGKAAQAGAARGGGALQADGDGGGGRGSSGQREQQGGQTNLGAGFRFNPALMAPVPVARPKETLGSDRLRQIANEIAQKIVERVRVGTNAAGVAEFQIDLRSNVLSGMSIKVSGGRGRIRLVFSGGDKEVQKLLEASSESLKQALGGRGLVLEELRIGDRA